MLPIGIIGQVLRRNGAAFMSDHVVALKAGGDHLRICVSRHEIARELLNEKAVVRLVVIECLNHPVGR